MAVIRPSADLRNNYSEISKICHETKQPIYMTKNGYNDFVLLSNEAYEELTNGWLTEKEIEKRISEKLDKQYADFEEFKKDVLEQINKAINEIEEGKGITMEEAVAEMEDKYHINEKILYYLVAEF